MRNELRSLMPTAALAAAGCFWGTGFLFGKIAFTELTVAENVCFRFICASIVLAPVLMKKWKRLRGTDLWLLLVASMVGVPLQFLVQFKGLQLTTASHASLIVGTLPVLLALSSALFLRERLNRAEWGIPLLSAVGALMIAMPGRHFTGKSQSQLEGDLLVLASLFADVVMILCTKRLLRKHDPLYVTAYMIVVGTMLLTVSVELLHPLRFHFSAEVWVAVAAQGVLATAGAYVLWNWGLERMPVSRAGVFLNLEPFVGALLGVLVLHEKLGVMAVFGGLLIISSAGYFTTKSQSVA